VKYKTLQQQTAYECPIGVVALVDGDEGKSFVGLDNVIAARHGFGFVRVVTVLGFVLFDVELRLFLFAGGRAVCTRN